jgi:glycosyltransferase involved in cell wall biosynthesis
MDIICFANDWDGDPLSKKHIMRRLARRGARVLWVNSLGNRAPRLGDAKDRLRAVKKVTRFARSAWNGPRQVDDRIWVVDPIAAPVYGSRWAARANALFVGAHVRNAAWRLGMREPVHYTFVPASAWVAGQIGERALVYHAADEYSAFGGADSRAIAALEDELLRRADLYIACSAPLLESKAPRCRKSILVRHGVEHEHFARALDPATIIPEALRALPKPVVGFVGLIAEWVDLELMGKLADRLAREGGGSLALVGDVRGADPSQMAALAARPNVLLAGRRPYAELPGWCRGFAVGILPFVVNELTRNANPLKLREYLAAGLPVVSTDIPESRALAAQCPEGLVVAGGDEFAAATSAIAASAEAGPQAARSDAVAQESWDHQVDLIARAIESVLSAAPARTAAKETPRWTHATAR